MACRRTLTAARHPAAHEGVPLQNKIVLRQSLGVVDAFEALLGIGRHHMGLDGLLGVVLLERREMLTA